MQAPTKQILVAKVPLERGRLLRASDLVWRAWPSSGIDQSFIVAGTRSADSFAGWVAREPVAPGDPLTDAKIVAPGDRGFLAAALKPGMRAVSVPVNATSGISGFIFPGDRVDILVTQILSRPTTDATGKGGMVQHKVAQTVLHNIRVIGIDQRLQGKDGEAQLAHTATLEVTPKQSEIIAVASEMGKLSLSLRSLAQASAAHEGGDSAAAADRETYTLDSEVSPVMFKPLAQSENSATDNVTILRGAGK
jgi:pilus assembly protein CpaB